MEQQQYVISPFLFMFESKKNGHLVYNGLNNSFIKINKNLFNLLNEVRKNKLNIDEIDIEIQNTFKKTLIFCNEEYIQTQILKKKFLKNYYTFQNNALNLTIAPTTVCNFSCFYCYEKGIEPKTIDDFTIEKLIEFIEEKSNKTQNRINIMWYGGEPLLAISQIQAILNKIKRKKINILSQGIVTNGYFLNTENIDFLKNNNINFLQITLDGLNPETHNNRRKSKDGNDSWNRILENIDSTIKLENNFNIAIRCNLDKENQKEFHTLKNYLENRWCKNPKITIYPAFLTNYLGDNVNCQYFDKVESSIFLLNQYKKK